jgi:hypothetical protein
MPDNSLIPFPDVIPAPVWLLITLEQLTFLLHIIVINIVLGAAIITLYRRFSKNDDSALSFEGSAARKLPVFMALAINFGVAPLLFLQVTFGHLFYSSSVLMAAWWILIIPFLILAYYGLYIHSRKYELQASLSKAALLIAVLFILYIGFMLVNNNSLMEQPEVWKQYFDERGGTILNLSDPTIIPRYLHFVAASIAIGGLFFAVLWNMRRKKGVGGAGEKSASALKIFAAATAVQAVVGFWYLLALPEGFIKYFMGGDLVTTAALFVGMAGGITAIVLGFLNKLTPAIITIVITLVAMLINRYNLRMLYLADNFDPGRLTLEPQYFVLTLFIIILLIGLASIWYMVKIASRPKEEEAAL